jgi:HSP20 family molecular chaperone IbpA
MSERYETRADSARGSTSRSSEQKGAGNQSGRDAQVDRTSERERSIRTNREDARSSPAFGGRTGRSLFDEFAALERVAWSPELEMFRRGDKLVIRADLPGLKKEDVKVEIDNGILTISGERCDEHEDKRDDYYRSERSYGRFARSLALPDNITEEQCDASFKDGVLEVTLAAPKLAASKARAIPIR